MRAQYLLILGVIAILLAGAAGVVYWLQIPRLEAFSPANGASTLPAGAQIRLTFSQPMQPETVIERLEITPARPGSFAWEGSAGRPEHILVFTPEQPWQAGNEVRVTLRPGARSAGLFAPAMRAGESWAFRIRQPELAYLYPSSGPANIYVLNPLSGASTALTANMGDVQDFSINASGSAIYYSSRTGIDSSAIFRLDLTQPTSGVVEDGKTPTPTAQPSSAQILHCPKALCRAVVISPDGKYLAYERTAFPGSGSSTLPQVWVLSLETPEGEEKTEPALAGDPDHETRQPDWSPLGMLTFYDRTDQAFIIADLAAKQHYRFPNQTGEPGSWRPNGMQYIAPEILFSNIQNTQALASSHLISFEWQNANIQDLTPNQDLEDAAPAFSPDGDYLAFTRKYLDVSRWTPGRQIWIMHLPSAQAQQMTDDPHYNHFSLAWNPAGDQLAYVRFNQMIPTEPTEIWLMDPLTGRAIQIIVGGFSPQWIP